MKYLRNKYRWWLFHQFSKHWVQVEQPDIGWLLFMRSRINQALGDDEKHVRLAGAAQAFADSLSKVGENK